MFKSFKDFAFIATCFLAMGVLSAALLYYFFLRKCCEAPKKEILVCGFISGFLAGKPFFQFIDIVSRFEKDLPCWKRALSVVVALILFFVPVWAVSEFLM